LSLSEALIANEESLLDLLKQTFAEEREKLKEHLTKVASRVTEAKSRIDSHQKAISDFQRKNVPSL
jgi:polyhydroxyalkanoate synthesis regulator protein